MIPIWSRALQLLGTALVSDMIKTISLVICGATVWVTFTLLTI